MLGLTRPKNSFNLKLPKQLNIMVRVSTYSETFFSLSVSTSVECGYLDSNPSWLLPSFIQFQNLRRTLDIALAVVSKLVGQSFPVLKR